MPLQKVHRELSAVDRETIYHLGHYDLDFQDGSQRFQLHARICGEPSCLCDNLQIDWLASESMIQTWYTAQREWRDQRHQDLHPELVSVFRIVEEIPSFQERYQHLVYLRRRQVLESLGRLEPPFAVQLPAEVIESDADPENGVLGTVRPDAEAPPLAYGLEFCGDPECFCDNLFLVLQEEHGPRSICIQSDDSWSEMEQKTRSPHGVSKLKASLKSAKTFSRQLEFFRMERMLHNYFRFVRRYA